MSVLRMRALVIAIGFAMLFSDGNLRGVRADSAKAPVLLELFTSEGCSSCPPADRLLMRFVRDGKIDGVPVIGLEWHVDYWNYIGWKDPFSAAKNSQRQESYARAISGDRNYTPQLVIDGSSETLGSNETQVRALVNRASQPANAKAQLALSRHDNQLEIVVSDAPADGSAELWLAITERELVTSVLRGENAGQKLAHGPVVRALRKLGKVDRAPFRTTSELAIERGWKRENLSAVAFVQRTNSLQILGANELPLAP